MRFLTVSLILALALAGCGKKGDDFPSLTVGGNSNTTAAHSGLYDLHVTGNGIALIVPSQTIRNLTVDQNGAATLGASSTISGTVHVGGNGVLHVPAGWTPSGTLSTTENGQVLYDSTAAFPVAHG